MLSWNDFQFSKMGNKEDCHVFQITMVRGIISNIPD